MSDNNYTFYLEYQHLFEKFNFSSIYSLNSPDWWDKLTLEAGVYCLLEKLGNTYKVFYIGQSKCIGARICDHLRNSLENHKPQNPLLKKYLEKRENCYYRFVVIKHWAKRNRIERLLIEKTKPECNRVPGIIKKPKSTMAKTIKDFLNKKESSWGPLASYSEELVFWPSYESESIKRKRRREEAGKIYVCPWLEDDFVEKLMAEVLPITIGKWNGDILIIPITDKDLTNGSVQKFRSRLKEIALEKGVKIKET